VTAPTAPRHRHLTPAMRDALRAARSQPLRRVHKPDEPGRPPWPAPAASLAALARRGFRGRCLQRTEQVSRKGHPMTVWTITDLGILSLEFVVMKSAAVASLRAGHGSTRPMQLGVWIDLRIPEPEQMRSAA
jgi:hypothetical protein